MLFRTKGLSAPIALIGCDELLAHVAPLMNGWAWQPLADGEPAKPAVITVEAAAQGWRIQSHWTPAPLVYDTMADIICALFADLIMAYVAADTRLLCLHAGAVRQDHGSTRSLIVFPAHSRAGKSTLSTTLALTGGALYSDDVLPVDMSDGPQGGQGVALGLAPRPRLPLPDSLSIQLRDRIAACVTVANRDHGYIALPSQSLAPHGEHSTIAAFIHLDRGTAAGELVPERRSKLMKLLLWQNFGARPPAAQMVARFAAMTQNAACWRLRYREADEAAELLTQLPAQPPRRAAS